MEMKDQIQTIDETQIQETDNETQIQETQIQETQIQETQIQETKDEVVRSEDINEMVEQELLKTLDRFINELDLVFDYIDKNTISELRVFFKSLNDMGNLKGFVKNTYKCLQNYENDISYITNCKTKIKTSKYKFLDDIVLFNNILDFQVFTNENKNTKRSIVKYLYNIYMSVFILSFGVGVGDERIDVFAQHLSNFINGIQEKVLQEQKLEKKLQENIVKNNAGNVNRNAQFPNLGGNIGGLLDSLMSNGEIMNLATDLSKDIESQNLDPMMLLSSMMSGKPNSTIQNLVKNISNKIETKINNGEIDKRLLEDQAKNILNTVNNSGDLQKMFQDLD